MPEQGILHVRAAGGTRFEVRSHAMQDDGLVVARDGAACRRAACRLRRSASGRSRSCWRLLAARVGPQQFPDERSFDDASWVGYRLAELLPLPLSIKQTHARDQRRRSAAVGLAGVPEAAGSRCRPGPSAPPGGTIPHSARTKRTDHGWPQQMGEHQAQEGGHRREAGQDLHAPHPRNHRRREDGRRRPVDESAAAARHRQGDGPEHAEGHDRARGQARRRRARGRRVRGDPLRRLRHRRRRGDRRLHDRQPHAHRRRRPACVHEVRRQPRDRRLGRLSVQALRPARLRARHRRERADGGGARRRAPTT